MSAAAGGLPSQIGDRASRALGSLGSWVSHATAPYVHRAIGPLLALLVLTAALIVIRLVAWLLR